MKPPLPPNESGRLQSLVQYGILDTDSEESFDDLTRLAAYICQTPIALVSFIDAGREWVKSSVGLDAIEIPREISFAAHAVARPDELLVVEDAAQDSRFAGNPLVTHDPQFRFYAGAPITAPDGHALGVLSVVDLAPRQLASEQIGALDALARRVMAELENRRYATRLRRSRMELDRLEAEVAKVRESAATASKARTAFIAGAAEEMRSQLDTISSASRALFDTSLTTKQYEAAEAIRKSGDSMLATMTEVLDLSRIEAGSLDVELIEFDLRTMVEELAMLVAPQAHSRGLHFSILFPPEMLSAVQGDPGRLRQILSKFLTNAIRFTMTGEILVEVSCPEESRHDALIRFDVRDTGPGVPAERIGELFNPVGASDLSISWRENARGIGLPVCRQLAELMGGATGVETRRSGGSNFWFTVRLRKRDKSATSTTERRRRRHLHNLHLLLVEPHPSSALALRQQVSLWGIRSEVVTTGTDALIALREAVARGDAYDVAIVDSQVSDLGACRLGRAIGGDASLRDTILLLATPAGVAVEMVEYMAAGYSRFLHKPVRHTQLYETLLSAVATGREGARAESTPGRSGSSEQAGPALRILVAEDNVVNQKVAVRMLEKFGCACEVVSNGREAVEAFGRSGYDVIFMDCQMPELDGFGATMQIRKVENPDSPRTPIVAMAATAMQGDRELCVAAGMDDFITKPVRQVDLARVISRWGKITITPPPVSTSGVVALPTAAELHGTPITPGGTSSVSSNILAQFNSETQRQLDALRQAVAEGQHVLVRTIARSLESTASAVGALRLSALSRAMANADGPFLQSPAAFDRVRALEEEFARVMQSLGRERV